MISVTIKVFENGQSGLRVNIFGNGAARSPREQIYNEELNKAIKGALLSAGKRVEEAGLGAPLDAGLLKPLVDDKPEEAPAPLSPEAVQIPFELPGQAAGSELKAPQFSQFVTAVVKDLRATAGIHVKNGAAGEERAITYNLAADTVEQLAQEFIKQVVLYRQQLEAQASEGGNN